MKFLFSLFFYYNRKKMYFSVPENIIDSKRVVFLYNWQLFFVLAIVFLVFIVFRNYVESSALFLESKPLATPIILLISIIIVGNLFTFLINKWLLKKNDNFKKFYISK